jgi:hypothetical protein
MKVCSKCHAMVDEEGSLYHVPGCSNDEIDEVTGPIERAFAVEFNRRTSNEVDPGTRSPHDVDYATLIGHRVTYHYDNGVELHAVVTRVYHPQLVNLRVYSDGYLDLQIPDGFGGILKATAGLREPVNVTNVAEGTGHLNFSWRLDRP